jgi:hypothetical protein
LNTINLTPFQAATTVITDKLGYERLLVVTKGTFQMNHDGSWSIAPVQVPLVYADEHYGEPGISSIRNESDFAFFKPQTDVLVQGHAYAPGGKPATSVDVELQIGSISKKLVVSGDRYWDYLVLAGWVASRPTTFLKMPIVYERSFGGTDTSHEDERKHSAERRNLVGTGFHTNLNPQIRGTMLPNVEVHNAMIRNPLDKVPVAGFGCIARCWLPRASFAGTYDQNWMQDRYPFLPVDFDERYFQSAPPDQTCAHLVGGEAVRLVNLTPEGIWSFHLPEYQIPMSVIAGSGPQQLQPVLDTVVLLPDQRSCTLTWRASMRPQGKITSINEIWVGAPSAGRQRAFETGKRYLEWLQIR